MTTTHYYTTVIREAGAGRKVGYLSGPYPSEEAARAQLFWVRPVAEEIDPRCAFDAFGTCSVAVDFYPSLLPAGRLDDILLGRGTVSEELSSRCRAVAERVGWIPSRVDNPSAT